ncbi:PAP2 superfamily protein [Mucilaginibacter mallensis]|uniref:PAP2 superfamily protein n=1 Tax=Mucilaginibacter mallensis TaxID=652787 RepID=A0A1H1ZB94_MUCMA|nr:phosphatase PAP2 family protein [Mucilaginibacter mallensis]SDT31065.1 PAP2 superfamily protein [Mucilaginibacter mallensis]
MKDAINNGVTVNIKSIIVVSLLSVAYLLLSIFLVGYKVDQLVLIGIFNSMFYLSVGTRKFILGFSIFIFYWVIFDYMKAFPNYNYNTVHIADLYNFEKHLFGINLNGKLVTPNEYFRLKGTTFLDIVTGLFYLCWIPVPLSFAAYLFFTRKRQFLYFALTFLLVNLLGFVVYYVYPAAPPWYIENYGFTFHPLTIGNTGGLAKFDAYFHINLFKSIYAKGSNVFAAMPSLHSAYPVIVLYYGLKNRLGFINILFFIVVIGIWFTAVYASHHFVLDVLAGITCAIIGISLFNLLISKVKFMQTFIKKYEAIIE